MFLLLSVALAIEPGASRGAYQPDCACMEVQPGAHADKHSTTWVPLAAATHLEHLEIANKPMLSAVLDKRRVSLAERDDIEPTASLVMGAVPGIELRDQGTGFECKHLHVPTPDPPTLAIVLEASEEERVDAATVGKVLRTKEMALRTCLGSGGGVLTRVQVSAAGKLSVSILGGRVDEEAQDCVKKALKGLKAELKQKVGGELQFRVLTQ